MTTLGVIPARYASSRFPGKPLIHIQGKSMIQRVYDQALQARSLSRVCVATDDRRIFDHVQAFGGDVVMTSSDHPSGTDRLGEVATLLPDYDYYINIQGDEPFIAPQSIDLLCAVLHQPHTHIATLIRPLTDPEALHSPHTVKVVIDHRGKALYFSRSPIPFLRAQPLADQWTTDFPYFQHIGIYGFTRKALMEITALSPSSLELAESLEQLRWLQNGYSLHTAVSPYDSFAIDTPEDWEKVK